MSAFRVSHCELPPPNSHDRVAARVVHMRVLDRSLSIYKTFGPGELVARVIERIKPPHPMSIRDLCGANAIVVRETEECLNALAAALGIDAPSARQTEEWGAEWAGISTALQVPSKSQYLVEYDVERHTARTLYFIARWRAPKVIMETGVARGASTFALLSAVSKNGAGAVYSLDVDENAGELVPLELRSKWEKRIVDPHKPKGSFLAILGEMPTIDFFFHDSNHRAPWMAFEFASVIPRLNPLGILGGDDVDMNDSFLNAALPDALRVILLDGRKASGFAVSTRA